MPIYNYKCKCGNIYEEIFDMSNIKKSIKCVNCGGIANLMPSSPALKVMGEKRKEMLRAMTGREINSIEDEQKYLKEKNLMTVSKKEWQEIKAKRDSAWNNTSFDKNKMHKNMIEGIKKVVENIDERRRINLYNLEKKKEAEKIRDNKLDAVKI